MKFKNYIASINVRSVNESSLTRVWKQVTKFDSGIISAFRSRRNCGDGDKYTRKENNERHDILKSKLMMVGYSITNIKGVYTENYGTKDSIDVKEKSFLVIDIKNSGKLKKDLIKIGTEFEQDSITYSKPNGEYYLISTNKCKNGYPGRGKIGRENVLSKSMFGSKGEFYSRVNGRPFVFESCDNEIEKLIEHTPTEIRSIKWFSEKSIVNGEVI